MRTALCLTALIAFGSLLMAGSPNAYETEYTGGTVASIPLKTRGQLDVSDSESLQFRYGKPSFKLPYSKITALELTMEQEKLFGKVPVPLRKTHLLTISFQGPNGERESVALVMSKTSVGEVVPVIEERSGKRATSPWTDAAAASNEAANGWWGDRYWRTSRNTAAWDKPEK